MTTISNFLDECHDVARLRYLAYSTEQSYTVEGNVAASTQNAALAALLFLYRDVLKVELPPIQDEVTAILGQMQRRYLPLNPNSR